MKQFKYVANRTNTQDFAEMYLYDEIGFDGVDGAQFAYELRFLTQYHEPPLKEVKVRINSVGGSVMDAFSIFAAIHNANKAGKVAVNTYNDGVAASSAGFILMAGKNVHAKDYSRLMLHGVSLLDKDGNPTTADENAINSMTAFKDMIKQVFANNTKVKPKKLEELLTNGKDNWFTAQEAAKAGFFPAENIENTGLEIDLPASLGATVIANRAQKIINNKSNTLKMKTVINLLQLQEGASEQVIANAVQAALKKADDSAEALLEATNKLTAADAKVLELQGEVDKAVNSAATTFVEAQIKEGKFTPKDDTEKAALVNQYKANPEGFKSMVAMMPTKAANVLGELGNDGDDAKSLLERVNNRSLRELEKQDPSLLAEIKNTAKGEFVKLWNKQYGTNKTEADFA